MTINSIRPIAIALLSWEDKILVTHYCDKITDEYFYRPLGGAINFGEHSHQTIEREIKEEIRAEIYDTRFLFTLENIFVCDGKPGHEIVQVYEATLEDKSLYGKQLEVIEDNGEKFQATWKSLEEIQRKEGLCIPTDYPKNFKNLWFNKLRSHYSAIIGYVKKNGINFENLTRNALAGLSAFSVPFRKKFRPENYLTRKFNIFAQNHK